MVQRTAQFLEVLEDRPGRTLCRVHFGAAEAVERLHPEMLAQRIIGLVRKEGVSLPRLNSAGVAVKDGVLLGHEHL